jgi:signal transduction histidine kinase
MTIIVALCLLIGMSFIGFAMMVMAQRDLIHFTALKGSFLINAIENTVAVTETTEKDFTVSEAAVDTVCHLIELSEFDCVIVLDRSFQKIFSEGKACCQGLNIQQYTMAAMAAGKDNIQYSGATWGIFLPRQKYMIISVPLFKDNCLIGGASAVFDLEKIFHILRNRHKLLLIYILVNSVILTFLGIYRLSKIVITPLQRLVKRAEEHTTEDEELFFLPGKEDNEFKRVSKSLNLMLQRILKNKIQLKNTIQSLEKANLDLQKAQGDIIRAEKLASVGRLSSGIAHEIGNPISVVLGYLELLKEADFSEDQKQDFLSRAETEINRIKRIIRQLLDFSRPSVEEEKLISVHFILEEIYSMLKFQPLTAYMDIELNLSAEKDKIVALPDQLRQVFLNLILNAADAIDSQKNISKGKLIIASNFIYDANCPILKLSFIDNGAGIPKDQLNNIYDPFFTTKEIGKGTGLGLSVSFMIIENIGGKITATSEETVGTTIMIEIPLHIQD